MDRGVTLSKLQVPPQQPQVKRQDRVASRVSRCNRVLSVLILFSSLDPAAHPLSMHRERESICSKLGCFSALPQRVPFFCIFFTRPWRVVRGHNLSAIRPENPVVTPALSTLPLHTGQCGLDTTPHTAHTHRSLCGISLTLYLGCRLVYRGIYGSSALYTVHGFYLIT